MATLYEAIRLAQAAFKPVGKNKTNPHFKSKYADYDALKSATEEALRENGLLVTSALVDGYVVTSIVHAESGEAVTSSFPVAQTDPQKIGSAMTYGRRYNLSALLDLCADDDDDGEATRRREAPAPDRGGSGRAKDRRSEGLDFIASALSEAFGDGPPWEPKEKLSVLKDLLGNGSWKTILKDRDTYTEDVVLDLVRQSKYPELRGKSRLERAIELVKEDHRRPDEIAPADWPHCPEEEG